MALITFRLYHHHEDIDNTIIARLTAVRDGPSLNLAATMLDPQVSTLIAAGPRARIDIKER